MASDCDTLLRRIIDWASQERCKNSWSCPHARAFARRDRPGRKHALDRGDEGERRGQARDAEVLRLLVGDPRGPVPIMSAAPCFEQDVAFVTV
jgi:hypothetical protein